MKWIGLTGGIASGKSTVSKVLQELGCPVVDADILARKAVSRGSPALEEIVGEFGAVVLDKDGALDRKTLGQLVFADSDKLKRLEEIIHPEVKSLALAERRDLESKGVELGFYDVPLLFEKKLQNQFDSVVVVYCPESLQRQRLKEREGLSEQEISQRLEAQLPIDLKLEDADFVIQNIGSIAELKNEVKSLVKLLAED